MTDDATRELSVARAGLAATRHNLAVQLFRVAEFGAPSRLAAVGTEAAREAAVAKARQLGQRALGVAATRAARPGIGGVLAGAAVPLAFLLLRRRRHRKEAPRPSSRLASVLRFGRSPLAGVLFSALSVLARSRR